MLEQAISLHREGQLSEAASLYRAILEHDPRHAEALHLLGVIELQSNNALAALGLIEQAIAIDPNNVAYLTNCGIALQGLNRLDDALACYHRALGMAPDNAGAFVNRGNALRAMGRLDDALTSYDRALAIAPDHPEALINRGLALRDLARFDDALTSFERAIQVRPDLAEAHLNHGNALRDLKRFNDALGSYDRALNIRPDYADALNNRGVALQDLKRFDAALMSFDSALAIQPGYAEALNNRGNALQDLKRFDDALTSYDRALAVRPGWAEAFNNRGNALRALKRFDDALASYDRAVMLKADYADAFNNRGAALQDLKRFEEAVASYDRALAIRPDDANAFNNRGNALQELHRYEEGLASYDRALAIMPDYPFLFGTRLHYKMMICDWRGLAADFDRLAEYVRGGKPASVPFPVVATPLSAALQRTNAEIYVREKCPRSPLLPPIERPYDHGRIRLGYFSADFHNHATANLTAELFERHDRTKFDVFGFSFGPPASDAMRARLEKSFDRFIDVSALSDQDIALLARSLEIDIAVDLKGFTQDSRPGIFALGAAPIQVNYLGYPGTMGADYIDYIIADPTLIPEDLRQHYAEKIVYLPDTYQPNNSRRAAAEKPLARVDCGLPDKGFVFCSFNNNFKITPEMFGIWMRLLARIDSSVLWLLEDNAPAAKNLRAEARARGIAPDRLVFAQRTDMPEHLARHRLADLFLDTLPYNAHTTASDALWMGLPLLTCLGRTFPGRVAASLLTAVGLPELIMHSLDGYEALALELAANPKGLAALREKLTANRVTYPLFDTARFTRHIESAYLSMVERRRVGLAPAHIHVPPTAFPPDGLEPPSN